MSVLPQRAARAGHAPESLYRLVTDESESSDAPDDTAGMGHCTLRVQFPDLNEVTVTPSTKAAPASMTAAPWWSKALTLVAMSGVLVFGGYLGWQEYQRRTQSDGADLPEVIWDNEALPPDNQPLAQAVSPGNPPAADSSEPAVAQGGALSVPPESVAGGPPADAANGQEATADSDVAEARQIAVPPALFPDQAAMLARENGAAPAAAHPAANRVPVSPHPKAGVARFTGRIETNPVELTHESTGSSLH